LNKEKNPFFLTTTVIVSRSISSRYVAALKQIVRKGKDGEEERTKKKNKEEDANDVRPDLTNTS